MKLLPEDVNIASSHCADAVLSFSNNITIVSDVALPLANFALRWVQSNSDYDTIVASAFTPSWASLHRPVLSRLPSTHTLYIGVDPLEPNGQLIRCHQGCGREFLEHDRQKKLLKVECKFCGSQGEMKPPSILPGTILGRKFLLKVEYPQLPAKMVWKFPSKSGDPQEPQKEKFQDTGHQGGPKQHLLSAPTSFLNSQERAASPHPSTSQRHAGPTLSLPPPIQLHTMSLPPAAGGSSHHSPHPPHPTPQALTPPPPAPPPSSQVSPDVDPSQRARKRQKRR